MARTRTLLQLRSEVRQRADVENATALLPDAEVTRYINQSIAELYDLLVDHGHQDWYLNSADSTATPGSSLVTLEDDFYLLRGVDLVDGSVITEILPFNFRERNVYQNSSYLPLLPQNRYRYRLLGVTSTTTGAYTPLLELIPTPAAADTIRVWYVPSAPELVDDTDVWDGFNGWEEYVVVDAAIKCLEKEESDTVALERRLARLRERIISLAVSRDIGEMEIVQDVEDYY